MTILVTGATGFVGQRLCAELRKDGQKVRATLRPGIANNAKGDALKSMGIETVTLDLSDPTAIADAMDGVENLYHLAWKSNRISGGATQGGLAQGGAAPDEINLAAMETMIGCARAATVKRFVFTSTVSVYGPSSDWGPLPRRETDGRADLGQSQNPYFRLYAGAKYRAEQMLKTAFPEGTFVILRPAMIYGPGAQFARQFVESAMGGGGAGPQAHPIQWVHVDDVVAALILAGDAAVPSGGTFNIAGATAVLNHTVAAEVRRLVRDGGPLSDAGTPDWNPRVPRYDTRLSERMLGFFPKVGWREGLESMVAAERASPPARVAG